MSYFDYYGDMEEVELFSVTDFSAEDMTYRSIAVDSRPAGDYMRSYEAPVYSMSKNSKFAVNVTAKSSSTASVNGCPSVPFGVSKTKFMMNMTDSRTVIESINTHLKSQSDFDFSHVEEDHMWKGKFLCGSSCFEVEINLYQDKTVNKYVVAVRKVSGCSAVSGCFNNFFSAMQSALCTEPSASTPVRKAFCIPTGICMMQMSDEQFLEGIQPIFRMSEHNNESRVQCAKMLCDVSQKDAHYLELSAFRLPCVRLLESLVLDESEDVRQYAVMAVAAFAELPTYKEALMCSAVLPMLFGLVENCVELQQAYETAQVRRTAARVLALLSRTHPYTVRAELQQQACDVAGWLQRVACLQDSRTREFALVAKSFLEDVSPSVNMNMLNISSLVSVRS
uniref:Uncharacterized protein n=1 Tax=Spumella elongata TaxID=89044 RepID=A0A7S3GQE8_9STRA|mmetsp:Transcript_13558/g.23781  ORF Transcript_13558/g.23781 Transcript_13558/m.23781 type:complete len:394 (+) Transcript_13558:90-1271(+)